MDYGCHQRLKEEYVVTFHVSILHYLIHMYRRRQHHGMTVFG